jgi:proteasome lid subunit RPN8/RPN11
MANFQKIRMSQEHWEAMRRHVLACLPEEACGILSGIDGYVTKVYPMINILHSPIAYRMEPEAQLRIMMEIEAEGLEIIGIFHSHPRGPLGPSLKDLKEAAYPEAAYLIWFPVGEGWDCQAFRIQAGEVSEVELQIAK